MSFMKKIQAAQYQYSVSAAVISRKLKRDIKLKDGRSFPLGSSVIIKFLDKEASKQGRICEMTIDGQTFKSSTSMLANNVSGFAKPSLGTLGKWMNDGVAKTVTGKRVEPDGYGDDNSPSWLLALGLI